MFKIVTSAQRHTSNREWIHSEFSFSFADYDDPSNAHFGALLAHNDNVLKPGQGMHEHPHHDMEIITYVISGVLRHQDDLGNHADLQAGSVQLMCAGTGINHSETNPSEEEDVRFLQMWILPDKPEAVPQWNAKFYPPEFRRNRLLTVVSGVGTEGALELDKQVNIHLSALETGQSLAYPQNGDRRLHLYVVSGNLEVTGADGVFQLEPGDAARIRSGGDLTLKGTSSKGDAELVLIDLP
ncbi:pirin family protein [Paenibacillus sp. NFR01]|uniref:pirin family protein n=1 Tax=Paenibacillus sp. NFR01 TaxID=1566279 RepID=UPI0008CCA461|nr:pirin family protein [Paenibacillus sp. NFR01]SEU25337.1 hypothetical protein SAMN03159358_4366 [Paenibacillus sp. NFR01]